MSDTREVPAFDPAAVAETIFPAECRELDLDLADLARQLVEFEVLCADIESTPKSEPLYEEGEAKQLALVRLARKLDKSLGPLKLDVIGISIEAEIVAKSVVQSTGGSYNQALKLVDPDDVDTFRVATW